MIKEQLKEKYLNKTYTFELDGQIRSFHCLDVVFFGGSFVGVHCYCPEIKNKKYKLTFDYHGNKVDEDIFNLPNEANYLSDYKHYNSFPDYVKIYGTLAEVDKESMEITSDKMTFYCRTPIDEYRITIPYLFFIEDKQDLTLFVSKESTGLQGCYYNKTNINDIVSNHPEFTNPLLKKIVYERFKFEDEVKHLDNSIKNLIEKRDNAKSQFLNCESALDILVPLISDEPISFEENNVITTVLKNKNGGLVQIVKSTKI